MSVNIEEIQKFWNNLEPWETEDDVPCLPIVNEEVWNNTIVPNIIRCGGIPKSDLEIGVTYIGACRNSSEATWDGEKFTYTRYKFGTTYEDEINHFQDDDGYDLFVPLKKK